MPKPAFGTTRCVSISDLIEAAPQNQDLKNQRVALLSQIGLKTSGE